MRKGIITAVAAFMAIGLITQTHAGTIGVVNDGEETSSDVSSPDLSFQWIGTPTIDPSTGFVTAGEIHIYHNPIPITADYTYDMDVTFDQATSSATGTITVTGPRNSDSQIITYFSSNLLSFDLDYYNLNADGNADVFSGIYRVAFKANNGDRIVTNAFEPIEGSIADTWIATATVPTPAAASSGLILTGLVGLSRTWKRLRRD